MGLFTALALAVHSRLFVGPHPARVFRVIGFAVIFARIGSPKLIAAIQTNSDLHGFPFSDNLVNRNVRVKLHATINSTS